MTEKTSNREYNVPQEGESDWHIPVNDNWHALDADVQQLFDDVASVDGGGSLPTSRTNVGALTKGTYHANAYSDGGYGVVFEASDLYIDSVVVDSDISSVSDSALTIELRQYQSGADDPTIVDSTTVTLSGGPERVPLGFTVPASGASSADSNDTYVLQRGPAHTDEIPLRRRYDDEGDWSLADYADETYIDPPINFTKGTLNAASASGSEPTGSWYYFFDWLVGPSEEGVQSPWSTDVDEIYMRPRDPTEEFDDVSPRALWIDTS